MSMSMTMSAFPHMQTQYGIIIHMIWLWAKASKDTDDLLGEAKIFWMAPYHHWVAQVMRQGTILRSTCCIILQPWSSLIFIFPCVCLVHEPHLLWLKTVAIDPTTSSPTMCSFIRCWRTSFLEAVTFTYPEGRAVSCKHQMHGRNVQHKWSVIQASCDNVDTQVQQSSRWIK